MRIDTKWKATLIFSLMLLLLFSNESLVADTDGQQTQSTGLEFILDQHQEQGIFDTNVHSRISLAQSFIPTVTPLAKIELKIEKPRKTDQGLTLFLRKSLDGSNLVAHIIPAQDIPYYTNWIEFDITDVDVTPGETYYIVLQTDTSSDNPYRWVNDYDDESDIYTNGTMYRYYRPTDYWEPVQTEYDFVDACFRTYSYLADTDLVCEGFFNWTDIKPAQDNLTGFFTVRNNGTPFSRMDWKITQWPSWGEWNFSKTSGAGLRPEDGYTTVEIFVEAPHSNVPDEYLGKIVIVNENDENDTAEIQARLVTQKTKGIHLTLADLQHDSLWGGLRYFFMYTTIFKYFELYNNKF